MKNDDALKKVLQEKIVIINSPNITKTIRKEISKVMYDNFNVQSVTTVGILNGRKPVETLQYSMLYKIMYAIKNVGITSGEFDVSELNEDRYFYKDEILEYSKPLEKAEEDIDLIIKDWRKVEVGGYFYYEIYPEDDLVVKWDDYNKLGFNPETQRDMIVVETNGIPLYYLDLNKDVVEEIGEAMYDGSYFPVPGVLCINPEEYDDYPVKFKNGYMIIDRKYKVDLIEGYHNYNAFINTKRKHPEWKYPCAFRLYIMNASRANDHNLQMNKKNKFKETQVNRIDNKSGVGYFIRTLNNDGSFILHNTINEEMFNYLFKLLANMFDIKKTPQAAQLLVIAKEKLNYYIMNTNHIKNTSPFTKEEWFILMYLIKKSIDNNIDFIKIINYVKVDLLLEEISFKNEALGKHYKILNNIVDEVMKNV